MNKNTICALLLGTSLISCNAPTETKADGSKVLYIPAECKEVTSLSGDQFWQLNCKDNKGKELYFRTANHRDNQWTRYEIVRQ